MTLPILLQGLSAGMNVGDDFTTAIGTAGLLSSPDPLGGSFDLNDLDEHNFPIEHDASLSRQDAYFGNDYSFNQTTFNQVLSYYAGMNTTSIPVASHAKYSRVQTESQRDPTFTYGPREFLLSYGETALYLSVMGDPTTGIAPVDYVEIFFGKTAVLTCLHSTLTQTVQSKNVFPTPKAGAHQHSKRLSTVSAL